jgi:hypothetical protein
MFPYPVWEPRLEQDGRKMAQLAYRCREFDNINLREYLRLTDLNILMIEDSGHDASIGQLQALPALRSQRKILFAELLRRHLNAP